MINKLRKLIHNRFSRFFKFIFFLRYLFGIFLISLFLFLSIPNFFDFKKKEEIIKVNLLKNFNLEIKSTKGISFESLPTPHLIIHKVNSSFYKKDIKLNVDKLIVYPKLTSIYNFGNLKIEKIKFINATLAANFNEVNLVSSNIFKSDKKINFENLKIQIQENKKNLFNIKSIDISNYGHNRNIVNGEIFGRNFQIKIKEKLKDFEFDLYNAGISASLNLNDIDAIKKIGQIKGKILKSNFKLNFTYDENLKINKFYFRDKNLSFNTSGLINIQPYFETDFVTEIMSINKNFFYNLNINELISLKKYLKTINSNNTFIYKSSKFSSNLINQLYLETKLAYGRLSLKKNFQIESTNFRCSSDINILENYPVLNFECSIDSSDKKKFLKKIKIKHGTKHESFDILIKGNLNVLNNKINFDEIEMNSNYKATSEDLEYFKKTFEEILFDQNFIKIFNLEKIKKFILEIS